MENVIAAGVAAVIMGFVALGLSVLAIYAVAGLLALMAGIKED